MEGPPATAQPASEPAAHWARRVLRLLDLKIPDTPAGIGVDSSELERLS